MQTLPDLSQLYLFIGALAVAGYLAGFLAGLFGVGGGAIIVPVLYQMLGLIGVDEAVKMHLAVGTSLAIIVPTSLQSFAKHRMRGVVDLKLLKSLSWSVPAGVICAAVIAAYISGASLRILFAIVALMIAMKLLFAKESWRVGNKLPGTVGRSVIGWLMGFFSTFMGVGGGVLNNTFMTLYGRPMHEAVATSAGVGVLISVPGVIGYLWAGWGADGLPPFSLGFINLLMVAMVIPVSLMAAPIGVKMAHGLSRRQLEITFGLFLVVVAARFFASLF